MNAREELRRYLRQRIEAGESELFLDELTAAEVLAMLQPLGGTTGAMWRAGEAAHAGGAGGAVRSDADDGALRAGGVSGATSMDGAGGAPRTGGAGRLLQALAEFAPGVIAEDKRSASAARGSAQVAGASGAEDSAGRDTSLGAGQSVDSDAGPGTGRGTGQSAVRETDSVTGRGMWRGAEDDGEHAAERSGPVPRDPGALRILGEEVAGCTACRLHEGRRQVVFGEGNAAAEVVIVGEAPGREEDRTGRPFVGPAGKLLDLLLQSAGFPREQVYICNVLKCRPPDNRDPLSEEVAACSAHLRRQLDAIRPTVLLAVGKFAAQALTGSEQNIGALRGGVHSYHGIPLVVSYHPAFLLRSPQWTRAAWSDFQLLRDVLEERRRS